MCARLPLNDRGMSIVMVLVITAVIATAALTVMTMGSEKRKLAQAMNVAVSANVVKQKLVGLVLSPHSWQKTQINNSASFAAAGAGGSGEHVAQVIPLSIYSPDSNEPFYDGTNPSAGFDLHGKPCASFSSAGNDACPFRYQISLKSRVFQNGNWIDTLHFKLFFSPKSQNLKLNASSPVYTFDLVRNLNDQSAEQACVSIHGTYNADTNACSVQITKPVAACGAAQTYRGPAANATSSNCETVRTVVTSCAGSQVIKGFSASGTPNCGAP